MNDSALSFQDYQELNYAFGAPVSSGRIKETPEDFIVIERLPFELSGEGEHLFLKIEKRGLNTEHMVKVLAQAFSKKKRDIAYAGLKDRQGITQQWFSVHAPGETLDISHLPEDPNWRVVEHGRHLKKLRTGAIACNEFILIIKGITAPEEVTQRLIEIKKQGVPNYFGMQRFGFDGQNLKKAAAFLSGEFKLKDRFLKGIYYSALRSYLFNKILSARVADGTWNKGLTGDIMQFSDSHAYFTAENMDDEIKKRLASHDISAAAVLWGRGEEKVTGEAGALQDEILRPYSDLMRALEQQGLERQYRSLRLLPQQLEWQWLNTEELKLQFSLRSGSYATAIVREILSV